MSDHTIEFINRAYELDLICKPGAPRFILIDGAAGYGKTYLLCRIKETYENEREGWKAALIDLKSEPQIASTDSTVAWPCIANAMIQQFGSTRGRLQTVPVRAGEAGITGALVPFLVRQRANILLLFDGVEVLARDTSTWLKRLVYDLDRGLQRGKRELRLVFAGRYVGDWGRGAPYALPTLPLSPFDQVTVRAMVEQMVQAAREQATPDHLADLTWWILRISGGHPQGICDVLEVIAAEGFVFADLEFTFLKMQFQRNGHEDPLFKLCIEPIVDEILRDVPLPLREVLAAISPIRRFDQELLDALLAQGVIVAPGYHSSWELSRALLQTRLISPPTAGDPMFSDQIVRRMLAMQMQIQHHDRYWQVNERALEIFHNWAIGRGSVDAQVRRVAIVESLYHTLQLEPQESLPGTVQDKLVVKLKDYLAGIQNMRGVLQLKDALAQDKELNDLIERRAGSAAIQALLDETDRYLP